MKILAERYLRAQPDTRRVWFLLSLLVPWAAIAFIFDDDWTFAAGAATGGGGVLFAVGAELQSKANVGLAAALRAAAVILVLVAAVATSLASYV